LWLTFGRNLALGVSSENPSSTDTTGEHVMPKFIRLFLDSRAARAARRRRTRLHLEGLEVRYAPATLVSPTRLSYQDKDGDNVTVTFSKAILTADNVNAVFTFDSGAGAVNSSNATREQLQKIDMTAVAGAAGTTVTTSATRSAVNGGDGLAALGRIDASAL